jgi:hypothetical protein
MNRLNWEINNRARWDEDVARRSPHSARQPLSDDEVESKRHELQQLARTSFVWRAFTYFMGCFACQTFWIAAAVFCVTRGVGNPAAWLFTAAACSGATAPFGFVRSAGGAPNPAYSPPKPGCKDCGS